MIERGTVSNLAIAGDCRMPSSGREMQIVFRGWNPLEICRGTARLPLKIPGPIATDFQPDTLNLHRTLSWHRVNEFFVLLDAYGLRALLSHVSIGIVFLSMVRCRLLPLLNATLVGLLD